LAWNEYGIDNVLLLLLRSSLDDEGSKEPNGIIAILTKLRNMSCRTVIGNKFVGGKFNTCISNAGWCASK
jgi:hypothetical protein